jgi:hypothetical protein
VSDSPIIQALWHENGSANGQPLSTTYQWMRHAPPARGSAYLPACSNDTQSPDALAASNPLPRVLMWPCIVGMPRLHYSTLGYNISQFLQWGGSFYQVQENIMP